MEMSATLPGGLSGARVRRFGSVPVLPTCARPDEVTAFRTERNTASSGSHRLPLKTFKPGLKSIAHPVVHHAATPFTRICSDSCRPEVAPRRSRLLHDRTHSGILGHAHRCTGRPVGAVSAAAAVPRKSCTPLLRSLNASEGACASGSCIVGQRTTSSGHRMVAERPDQLPRDDAQFGTTRLSLNIFLNLALPVRCGAAACWTSRGRRSRRVADAHRVSVLFCPCALGPSAMLLLDWVGGLRPDPQVTVGRPHPSPAGASGVILAAFGEGGETELEVRLASGNGNGHRRPTFTEFMARVRESKAAGFAVDRGTLYRDVTLVSVPVLSPTWDLLLILTAAGHPHDLDDDAVGALSRALQAVAGRLSDSLPLLRLG